MTHTTRRRLLQTGTALAAFTPLVGACTPRQAEPTLDEAETPPPAATDTAASYTAPAIPDGTEQLAQLASGETTSLALTETAIARSRGANALINAIAYETYDEALEASATPPEGAFGGVPTFIKDLLDWQGHQTLYGSRAFEGYIAPADAPFAEAWREAGVISLGKSTTPEMGSSPLPSRLSPGPPATPMTSAAFPAAPPAELQPLWPPVSSRLPMPVMAAARSVSRRPAAVCSA